MSILVQILKFRSGYIQFSTLDCQRFQHLNFKLIKFKFLSPLFRKFAAHFSSSQQPRLEEPKKAKTTSVSDRNLFGDCIFVDAEEHRPEEQNHPEPMSFDLLDQEELHEISLEDDHMVCIVSYPHPLFILHLFPDSVTDY